MHRPETGGTKARVIGNKFVETKEISGAARPGAATAASTAAIGA
jgi:hypothetical protein